MKIEPWFSWACPSILDEKGKRVSGGCGGNWGPQLPLRCPGCGGKLLVTDDKIKAVNLDILRVSR